MMEFAEVKDRVKNFFKQDEMDENTPPKLSEMTLDELWHLFPIELKAPDSRWSSYYDEMEVFLGKILNAFRPKINHIGSTAILGIWAKPIVDILVELDSAEALKESADILTDSGFLVMSRDEKRISLNMGYTEKGFAEKVYHIHLRISGDNNEIYFRNYMNLHSDTAKEYEALKLKLWRQYEFNRDGYTEAKTEFIQNYTEMAKCIDALLSSFRSDNMNEGYHALLELEEISEKSNAVYFYTEKCAEMVSDKNYYVRVRGFRLFCKQARWDVNNLLDKNIDRVLDILHDEKPTALRQALAALTEIIKYKPELAEEVCRVAESINYLQYKDSM